MKFISIIALCALLLNACSSDHIVLSLHTGQWINPDVRHRALVLYIKVYQLRDQKAFEATPIDQRWAFDRRNSIISTETFWVKHHDVKTVSLALHPNTKYVGIVADFRQTQAHQSLIIPIIQSHFSTQYISLSIQKNQLILEAQS